jgi:hypothetical protein
MLVTDTSSAAVTTTAGSSGDKGGIGPNLQHYGVLHRTPRVLASSRSVFLAFGGAVAVTCSSAPPSLDFAATSSVALLSLALVEVAENGA